jgi:superfamily I DNA and RNA helicase
MQNLYLRPAVELPGWVTLHADVNYRSPRQVLAALEQFGVPERAVVPGSPIGAGVVEFSAYDDTPGLLDATKRAVTLALAAGLRKEDIVVLSFSGRGRSRLLPFDKLGPHTLRRFTGRYDLFGAPEYTEGDLLVETVYRFKGQAAPCVVFTEIDFEAFDERARRKLFVGMTRAGLRLHLVLSRAAERCLEGRLQSAGG